MATEVEARYEIDIHEVEYQRQGDRVFLARVYQPRGPGPFPTMLEVHGGAWHLGDRLRNAAINEGVAAGGVVVAAIDFRQSHDAPYPAPLTDINLGIRWLKAHAAQFNGRPDIGGMGSSSGGHQILLSMMRPLDPRYTVLPLPEGPRLDARLKFVATCWPISDPLARYQMAQRTNRPELVSASEAYFTNEETMREANPYYALERGEPVDLPPVLIIQGSEDANAPLDMQQRFVEAYARRGGQIEMQVFPGMPHMFITREPERAESLQAIQRMVRFIREQANGGGG